MFEENIPVVKMARSIEILLELIAEIFGLLAAYYIFEFVGKLIIGSNFRSDMLLSIVVLPAIYILRGFYAVFSPYFVTIKLHEYTITVETGILTKRIDSLKLKTVENIELITTPLGRLVGYSTLSLYACGSAIHLPNVKSPFLVKEKINEAILLSKTKEVFG